MFKKWKTSNWARIEEKAWLCMQNYMHAIKIYPPSEKVLIKQFFYHAFPELILKQDA